MASKNIEIKQKPALLLSCSTLLDGEELWVKGSSANECLFSSSEGPSLHLADRCIFKQNLKSKQKCTLVFFAAFSVSEDECSARERWPDRLPPT